MKTMTEQIFPEQTGAPKDGDSSLLPSRQGVYAGFLFRFLAFSIDLMIVLISLNVIISVAGILLLAIHGEGGNKPVFFIISFLFSNLFFIAYFTWFHSEIGGTPGKQLLGIKVVSQFGEEVGFSRSLFRSFGYYLSFAPFFAGFIWVLISPSSQSWHDKLAGTFVTYKV